MNTLITFLIIIINVICLTSANDYTCNNIGADSVFYDPSCSQGQSLGCNAGGQGQNCRFCGFGPFTWPCNNNQPQPGSTIKPQTTNRPQPTNQPQPSGCNLYLKQKHKTCYIRYKRNILFKHQLF